MNEPDSGGYLQATGVPHVSLRDQCTLKGSVSRQAYLTENSSGESCDNTAPE